MGMRYDSSLMEYDVPYLIESPNGSLVELPISLILDDWEIFGGSLFPEWRWRERAGRARLSNLA